MQLRFARKIVVLSTINYVFVFEKNRRVYYIDYLANNFCEKGFWKNYFCVFFPLGFSVTKGSVVL